MKNIVRILIVLCVFLTGSNVLGATKVFEYGFEDWTGGMDTTPGYPFTSGYAGYMDQHAAGSEVITSYNANEMGQIWTAHSGSYFLIQNDSSSYALSPSVPGVTGGSVNLHNNVGYDGTYGGQSDFDLDEEITTGELFISFWARNNRGWRTIESGGRCKWIRVYANTHATNDTIYMHLSTGSVSPKMYFYCSGEAGAWIPSEAGPTLTNAYDGNWHKYSMYINWNTGVIRAWYDVDNETAGNATKTYTAGDGALGNGSGAQYVIIKSNYSAKSPTEETYHAIDDIEIWDGMPNQEEPEDDPAGPPGDASNFTAQPGDGHIALSWTNPDDSDFKGTIICYSTEDEPYPATHTDGTFVCNREAAPGSNDSHPATGLINGTKYNFSAFTYDNTYHYSEAAHVSTTPQGGGDILPPTTSNHSPPKGSTGFYGNSNIIVHIQDSGDGVDQSSIVMRVNGQTVSPTISGTESDYTLSYNPPNPLEGQVVVTLNARDLANPANVMPQETYTFTVSRLSFD